MAKLFDELKALKDAYDTKLKSEGQAALKEAFKEIFDKHPRLESIMWVQFTPYFNDGDPCYFGVRDFDVSISEPEEKETSSASDDDEDGSDEELYGEDYSYGDRIYAMQKSNDPDLKKIAEDVGDLNSDIPDDVLESVFGDHCKVTATREGFQITEFDHD
jgi:hypothetical protein